ncbi:cytochrome C [Candidatus Marinamargulisbacteria bacterium SCGC AG-414-C22]|nr:cytochrome C [Candidatus Marinamargulisbacteria bacterium SCGC AG-414-C22]
MFPKWANKVPLIIATVVPLVLVSVIHVFHYWLAPSHLEVGYQPKQPIPYSHRLHAGELGIDCRYCHYNVETAAHANIPSAELCLNCHDHIKTDSPYIEQIREHYESGEPIEWVKVHMLPDYAYFNHSRHVNSGVSCVQCHGRVDQMDVVRQVEPLSMVWCLECHRNPEEFVWPKDKVTQLWWTPEEDQIEMGERLVEEYHLNPKVQCSVCHR